MKDTRDENYKHVSRKKEKETGTLLKEPSQGAGGSALYLRWRYASKAVTF